MSNKKLRNVRFEVPQMSEKWAGQCCFRPLRMLRRLRKNSGPMRFGRFVAAFFCPMGTGDIWSNESGEWLKVPKDFRCSEHDERLS